MILLQTALWIGAWAAAAVLAQHWIGAPAGWIVFCAALMVLIAWRAWRLQRVSRWMRDPESLPPANAGPWDDIVAPLYRHTRSQARELTAQHSAVASMLAAAEALPDGVVALSDEFHIDWCNRTAREHLGIRLPADRGHHLLNLVRNPEFAAYAEQDDWPEAIAIRLTHGKVTLALSMQLTSYSQGQRLLITRDISQLEKLETTRRDFVANVSHELRTPLTVLIGFFETLRDLPTEALSQEKREQYMAMMHEQASRMHAIVSDLLTLSTLESSPDSPPYPAQMASLLVAARQQAEALSGEAHRFTWDIDSRIDVLGVQTELSSAVSNLLTNAVRYTPAGGRIVVRWTLTPGGGARYSVQDSGIGIERRHIPRLTERFYRVDRGRSRAAGGTGLGLAITKHIALRHNAELEILSEIGQGSTFSLLFPPQRVIMDSPGRQ